MEEEGEQPFISVTAAWLEGRAKLPEQHLSQQALEMPNLAQLLLTTGGFIDGGLKLSPKERGTNIEGRQQRGRVRQSQNVKASKTMQH